MNVEIAVNGSTAPNAAYVSWAPSPCRIRVVDAGGATVPVNVTVGNAATTAGGRLVFWGVLPSSPQSSLALTLPVDGTPTDFWVGGQFGSPSGADKDTTLEVVSGNAVVGTLAMMVRIRKNANSLTDAERDRFLAAMAKLNDRGHGPFKTYRDMHTNAAVGEAHNAAGFPPWHRTYILDLERSLQEIDSSVALPYWRFDQPAPRLFAPDFLGTSPGNGNVQLAASNPLIYWTTDGVVGFMRYPFFQTPTSAAMAQDGTPVKVEGDTLNTGGGVYEPFRDGNSGALEDDPHGMAHVSFNGPIDSIPTAARDPLFFLLHANVDRLWAKWQWYFQRFDYRVVQSFDQTQQRVGHNLGDTMWPWNGMTTPPRPPTAPGGGLRGSPVSLAPGQTPRVLDLLDFQGRITTQARLGYDYDDVPFE